MGEQEGTEVVYIAGLHTILVLTGSSTVEDIEKYRYPPGHPLASIAERSTSSKNRAITAPRDVNIALHWLRRNDLR